MKVKAALLLVLLVLACTPITTAIVALTVPVIIPTINVMSLVKTMATNVIFGIQPMGDPVDDVVGPG